MSSSATGVGMTICFLGAILLILTQKSSQKFGDVLGIMEEMMAAGNFGHYDERMKTLAVNKGKLSYQLQKALRRFKRNLRFLTSYPEEVICEPFARIYHFIWRKLALYRF